MADRRPKLVPLWATDANYVAGPDPWNGTATKIAIPSGLRAQGYEPKDEPGAQHVNQQLSELGQWFDYLKDVQMQNWTNPVDDEGTANAPKMSTALGTLSRVAIVDAVGRIFVLDAGSNLYSVREPGREIILNTVAGIGGSDGLQQIAQTNTLGRIVAMKEGRATTYVSTDSGETWGTSVVLSGTTPSPRAIVFVPTSGNIVIVGDENAGTPSAWYSTNAGASYTRVALPTGTRIPETVQAFGNFVVAMGTDGTGTNVWYSTDGGVNWSHYVANWTTLDDNNAVTHRKIAVGSEVFLITADSGEVWTAPNDGTATTAGSWTNVFSPFFAATFKLVIPVSDRGTTFVAIGSEIANDEEFMVWSTDNGVTWRRQPRAQNSSSPTVYQDLSYGMGRWAALMVHDGDYRYAESLHVGASLSFT